MYSSFLFATACPAPPGTKITFKGREITAEWIRTDPERMSVPGEHSRLSGDRAFLIGYGHERFLHHHSTASDGGYDIAWLSKNGIVVEMTSLPEKSEEGVTSTKEAQYALFLPTDWLKSNGAAVGDAVGFGSGIPANPPVDLPEIRVGGVPVRVEVSTTSALRTRGLMHRRRLSDHNGMLFAFTVAHELNFWMGSCHFPLDIAFFDADGKFMNLVPMNTYPDPKVDSGLRASSDGKAKYVFEANLGWFQSKGLADATGKPLRSIALELPGEVRSLVERAK